MSSMFNATWEGSLANWDDLESWKSKLIKIDPNTLDNFNLYAAPDDVFKSDF